MVMTNNAASLQTDALKDLFQEGERFFNGNDMSKARVCFEKIVALYPQNTEALNNLGVILFHEGKNDQSSELFEKALSIDPSNKDTLINLSFLLRSSGQLTKFINYLEDAMRLKPHDHEIKKLFQEFQSQHNHNKKRDSLADIRMAEAFFVLSTGRCGINTLSQILSMSKKVRIQHGPNPIIGEDSPPAWWGDENKNNIFKQKIFPLISSAMGNGLIYGEANPALTPFADVIARELPNAKFLILVRNPYHFVQSAIKQNYYQGHPEDILRLQPPKHSEFLSTWKSLSQIEKICWFWSETYRWILDVLSEVEKERYLIVHFEDIQSHSSKIKEIFEFLTIDEYCEKQVEKILAMHLNSQSYGRFPTSDTWSHEIRNIVNTTCGALAKRLGYESGNTLTACVNKANKQHRQSPPMVSIGIPLYSGGTMLADSLESILSQEFGDFEIIISDHGSDPFIREVALHYEKLDHRIKYFPTDDHSSYIGVQNFFRVVELSSAPFFMWGSYDDRMHKSYIRKCLEKIQEDDSIALVYTKSKVYQNHTKYLGAGNDSLKADQDDPSERFLHVIRELMMCNAFYGLFRRNIIRRARSFRKNAYAHDTLFLAEIALMGKIIQLDDYLFIRHLTRNYERTIDEHYTDMIRSFDPPWLEEGITLPFCRLAYSHCELINYSSFSICKKEQLTRETIRCFRERWDKQLRYEIDRAIKLINAGFFYCTWDGRHYGPQIYDSGQHLLHFHITDVLKALSEALFIYPEWEDLKKAYTKCLHTCQELPLSNTNN